MASKQFAAIDLEAIRRSLGEPDPAAKAKIMDELDDNCLAFLAHSSFCTIATADADGNCDSSPRGDYPGFVRALDSHTLVIPERMGNKLADSLQNIVQSGHIGLLCFVPGMSETLRINGRATVTDDVELMAMLEQDHVTPDLAIVVHTEEVYLHCGRALLRGGLWDAEMQELAAEVPSAGRIWASMSGLSTEVGDAIDEAVAEGNRTLY